MRWFPPAVAVLGVALAVACGDDAKDGKNDDQGDAVTLTGKFIDSPVAGLHFSTATQDGVTSAAGEFTYLDGEVVTFALGAVVLGSAPGAAQVTPFDLFGLTPPTTQRAISRLLTDGTPTAFDRVANIALFLQSLDKDGDPSNGLDLEGWDSTLADETLTFDHDMKVFVRAYRDAFIGRYAGIHDVVETEPLAHLYASLGLAVPAYFRTTTTEDSDNDGATDRTTVVTYDTAGRPLVGVYDTDGDSDADRRETFTYDARGRRVLTTIRQDSNDDNAGFEDGQEYANTYDTTGRLAVQSTSFFDNDVVTRSDVFTVTRDGHGRSVSETREVQSDSDAALEERYVTTTTYDDVARTALAVFESDSVFGGPLETRNTFATTYDAQGRVTERFNQLDSNNDGIRDSALRVTQVYDAQGRLTQATSLSFATTDTPTSGYTTTTTYDASGRVSGTASVNDDNGDGVPSSRSTYTRTWDANGNLITGDSAYDQDGDGDIDARTREIFTYDAFGQNISTLVESDANNDGIVDSRSRTTTTWHADGYPLTVFDERDEEADGIYDSAKRWTYAYTLVADGLRGIVHESLLDE